MQTILRQPGMKLVFLANFVSMVGSGITSAGVTWYVLQRTGSEMALGWLVFLIWWWCRSRVCSLTDMIVVTWCCGWISAVACSS
jgi:hypothetical protein